MTTQLPRPIEPGEAQSGDTIERRFTVDGCAITQRMTVARVEGNTAFSSGDYPMLLSDGELILIDRPAPTPAPAVGSRWRGEDGSEWVISEDGSYLCYRGMRLGHSYRGQEVDALTPIPDHGDGCSPWLWEPEADTGWVESAVPGGTRMCVQVYGRLFGDGVAAHGSPLASRLRPWSERGQANG